MIAPGLTDWKVGASIWMGPTGHDAYDSDYSTIKTYDSATGKLTLEKALSFYHHGAAASTTSKYSSANGQEMDIR
jgi:hypothetical protein